MRKLPYMVPVLVVGLAASIAYAGGWALGGDKDHSRGQAWTEAVETMLGREIKNGEPLCEGEAFAMLPSPTELRAQVAEVGDHGRLKSGLYAGTAEDLAAAENATLASKTGQSAFLLTRQGVIEEYAATVVAEDAPRVWYRTGATMAGGCSDPET